MTFCYKRSALNKWSFIIVVKILQETTDRMKKHDLADDKLVREEACTSTCKLILEVIMYDKTTIWTGTVKTVKVATYIEVNQLPPDIKV